MYARADSGSLDELDDAQLVLQFRNGNDLALHVLLRRHSDALYRFCLRLAPTREDAEDICQESLARAIDKVDSLAAGGAFRTWLFRIARNLMTDSFRSRRRLCRLPDEEDAPPVPLREDGPYSRVEVDEEHRTVSQAFLRLTESHQRVLLLREVEGLSYKEIAQRLNVSQSAVETLLFRARRRLRQEYGKSERVSSALGLLGGIRGLALRLSAPIAGGSPVVAKVAVTVVVLGGAAATVRTLAQPHAAAPVVAAASPRFKPHHVQRGVAPIRVEQRTTFVTGVSPGLVPLTMGGSTTASRSRRTLHHPPRFSVAQPVPVSRQVGAGAPTVPRVEASMGTVAMRLKRSIESRRQPAGSAGTSTVHEADVSSSGGQQTRNVASPPATAARTVKLSGRTSPSGPASTSPPSAVVGRGGGKSGDRASTGGAGSVTSVLSPRHWRHPVSRSEQNDALGAAHSSERAPAGSHAGGRHRGVSGESHVAGRQDGVANAHGAGDSYRSGGKPARSRGTEAGQSPGQSNDSRNRHGHRASSAGGTSSRGNSASATPTSSVAGDSTSPGSGREGMGSGQGSASGQGTHNGQGSSSGKASRSSQGSASGNGAQGDRGSASEGANQGAGAGQGTATGGTGQGSQSGSAPVQPTALAVVTAAPVDATPQPAHGQGHGNDAPPVQQPTTTTSGQSPSTVVPAATATDPAHGRGRKP